MITIEKETTQDVDMILEQIFGPVQFCSYCVNTAICSCENKECKRPLCDSCAIQILNLEIYYCPDCLEELSNRNDVT